MNSTSIDFGNFLILVKSPTVALSIDNSSLPCGCLLPPPDFKLAPPPFLPDFGAEVELTDLAANDPTRSCASNAFGNGFLSAVSSTKHGDVDRRTVESSLDQYWRSYLGLVVGTAILLGSLSTFLVLFYCCRKWRPTYQSFVCCSNQKRRTVRRHLSRSGYSSPKSLITGSSSSHHCIKTMDNNFIASGSVVNADQNFEILERPVGADWTYRSVKKKATPQKQDLSPIYDVPQTKVRIPDSTAMPHHHTPQFLPYDSPDVYYSPVHRLTSLNENSSSIYEEIPFQTRLQSVSNERTQKSNQLQRGTFTNHENDLCPCLECTSLQDGHSGECARNQNHLACTCSKHKIESGKVAKLEAVQNVGPRTVQIQGSENARKQIAVATRKVKNLQPHVTEFVC